MYKKVENNLNFVEREKQIEQLWKDKDIFNKSMDTRKKARAMYFTTVLRRLTASRT